MYLVRWTDANHDNEYDGPSAGFESSLIEDSHVGFHTKTAKDHIVLASSCIVLDGANSSRWHLTVPRVHITAMLELEVKDAGEVAGAGEVGEGGVSR